MLLNILLIVLLVTAGSLAFLVTQLELWTTLDEPAVGDVEAIVKGWGEIPGNCRHGVFYDPRDCMVCHPRPYTCCECPTLAFESGVELDDHLLYRHDVIPIRVTP